MSTTYDWYNLINLDDFDALDLISKELTLNLDGLGDKTCLISKSNGYSILYDGNYLLAELNDKNPFEFEDHAAYIDGDNNLWLGIKTVPQP